jgi:DNA-binding transcriptional LysR family regulator
VDLDLRVLRYFVAVAEHGTYTAAAAALHIATPSLSQQIRKLEHDLGVRLLERDHRGARLTPAGEEVCAHAKRMLAEQDQLIAIGRQRQRVVQNTLRIGFLSGMAGVHTRALLDRVRDRAPAGADIQLCQVGWADQLAAVLDGRVDATLARPPLPPGPIRRILLLTEPRVLVMSSAHPLARYGELQVPDLADVVQVNTDGVDEAWRAFWTLDPRPDGSRPRYGPMVHSVEEMLDVCASTAAVGITAASIVDLFPRPDLAYRPITDIEPTTVELILKQGALAPLTRALAEAAAEARWGGPQILASGSQRSG